MFNIINKWVTHKERKVIDFCVRQFKLHETSNKIINDLEFNDELFEIKKEKNSKKAEKKRKNKLSKNKDKTSNIFDINLAASVTTEVQINCIYKSLKQNYIFYISILCAIYAFSKCSHNKSSIILGIYSMIFITFYGYFIHVISHFMKFRMSEIYSNYDNIFTRNKYFNWCALNMIEFGEFHARTHHDTNINKSKKNIILEFFNNFITQGAAIVVIKFLLDLIDNRVILLWALFYATVHNINYNIKSPLEHQQHHINDNTNFGIDIWDIIIGTKYDWGNIETHNHAAINIIIIAAIIYYVSNKLKL
jgi:hypothetical protein